MKLVGRLQVLLLLCGVQLACVSAVIQKFPNMDIMYPNGMAVKETSMGDASSESSTTSDTQSSENILPILSNKGSPASTVTSIWTILPPDISINTPTVVMQLQQPDTTVTVTASPVTTVGATVTQTNTQSLGAVGSKVINDGSPVTSQVTGLPSMTTSTSTVFDTVTESGTLATVTSTYTATETYTPSPVTANAKIVTETSVATAGSTLTTLATITPSPVYSTITFGSRAIITVYSTITVAAPRVTTSPSPTTTSEVIQQPPPETPPPEEQQPPPEEQQPPVVEQQPEQQSSRSVICSWKVIGGRTIYRCHYSDEPWW